MSLLLVTNRSSEVKSSYILLYFVNLNQQIYGCNLEIAIFNTFKAFFLDKPLAIYIKFKS